MNVKKSIWLLALVLLFGTASHLLAQSAPQLQPLPPGTLPPGMQAVPGTGPSAGPTTHTDIPGADFSKLSDAQKALAFKIANEERCTCGCGYTIADCRHKDQKCPVSPGLVTALAADILAGKPEAEIRKGFAAKAPPPPPPPLDTKVNNFDLSNAPIKGPKDARVTIVEYSDFQCPFCGTANAWANEILAAYPKDVKLAFKHYPLPFHNQAHLAAQASIAAQAQSKFWEMHDKLFANLKTLSADGMKTWAKEIGLDTAVFNKALDEGTYKARVDKEMKEGAEAGVQGTPTFFINGKKYNGQRDLTAVKKIIDEELKNPAPKAASAAAPAADAKAPAAKAAAGTKTGSDK